MICHMIGILLELHEQIQRKNKNLTGTGTYFAALTIEWKKLIKNWHDVKQSLREEGKHLNILLTMEDNKGALYAIGNYIDYLHEFEKASD